MMGYTVEFINEKAVPIELGETLLRAALRAGISHYHACGAKGLCTTCRVLVQEGLEHLSKPNSVETAARKLKNFPNNVRLACQTKVSGEPVKLHRIIKDETDHCLHINEDVLEDGRALGVQKELALFFIDIRNFTPLIESNFPFDVIHIVRRLFVLFTIAIEENNGKVIETAGDGLYAVFGFDSNIENAVKSAVFAGQKILDDLKFFNKTYLQKYFDLNLEVGIGLHAGMVIYGNVGIGINNNLTVMGLPVNIAARLQTATKEVNNSFVISETAFNLLKAPRASAGVSSLHLKGVKGVFNIRLIGEPFQSTSK